MKLNVITKALAGAAVLALAAGLMTGCTPGESRDEEKLKIVTTVFPEYDWVRELMGERAEDAEITLLTDGGVDMHSYQPTVEDIAKIHDCDLFIYVGGESDGWVSEVLTDGQEAVCLIDVLGSAAKEEELKEGMEAEEEEEEEEGEEEPEYDEHVWLSLRNAGLFCKEIEGRLEKLDPEGSEVYKASLDGYLTKLDGLDRAYTDAVSAGANKTLIFADRFPFRYLTDDYGLDYYAAFVGCSAETEASFDTVVFLAGKADEVGAKHILTIESSDGRLARTVIDNTSGKNQDVLVLDSLQSAGTDGPSYLEVMEKDLEVLKKAMG